jgi:hypothetical protein
MLFQTHISFPSFSLTPKALHESAFKKLKMDNDKKNIINKEMVIDILMVALLAGGPILLALVL